MGCGCKNKGNQAQMTPEQLKEEEIKKQQIATQRSAQLKDSIKKTVEKYYNQSKNNLGGSVR